jgi:hypothetical protein
MSRIATKLLVSAAALAALTTGAAHAQYANASCYLEVSNSGDGSGFLAANAAMYTGGHWEMDAYQITPTGALDMSQSGPVRVSNGRMSTLTRNYLMTMYSGPAAYGPETPFGVRRQNDRLNEGRYGVDVSVAARLRVFDSAGRLVCTDSINEQAIPANPPRRMTWGFPAPQRMSWGRGGY